MARDYNMSEREAEMIHKLVDSHLKALKNWIASAVEDDRLESAKLMIVELRAYEKLFARTNVEAHRDQDKLSPGKMATGVQLDHRIPQGSRL